MAGKQFTMPWVIATIVAALGILSPIGWEHYKSRSRLELQQLTSTVLVEKTDGLSKLRLSYDGRDITCLRMLQFLLLNSGRRPIRMEDFIRPVTLQFDEGVDILDARIDASAPDNVTADIQVVQTSRVVRVTVPLLNPDDRVLFTVFASGAVPVLKADARIVYVRSLTFSDRVAELKQPPQRISWTVYAVGFFTIMFILAFLAAHQEVRKHRRLARLYLKDDNSIPRFETKDEYVDFVKTTFSYMTPAERKKALDAVESERAPLTPDAQRRIETVFKGMLGAKVASHGVRTVFLTMAALGLWYVLARVL